MTNTNITPEINHEANIEIDAQQGMVSIGQWYWVREKEEPKAWLGCVMHIGSNFIKIQEPRGENGYFSSRIHFDEFLTMLTFEPNASYEIKNKVGFFQGQVNELMSEVKAVTARLGVFTGTTIQDQSNSSTSVAVMSEQHDINDYKNALVLAKDVSLPDLFEKIKKTNGRLAQWMGAEILPLLAASEGMNGSIDEIKSRIFNVSLYAGLMEDIKLCSDGEPAEYHEKLNVMQRRLYMDEECLLGYKHGGLEFKNIEDFDAWISLTENRDRILPFQRTMVAMRVRRQSKEREWDGQLISAFVNIQLRQSDAFTFLYIRNGEKVYRLSTELDFGEQIFPDLKVFSGDEPMMVKMFCDKVDKMMTVAEYEQRMTEKKSSRALYDQWFINHPNPDPKDSGNWSYKYSNPHRNDPSIDFEDYNWKPFDDTNVYYDECMKDVQAKIKEYNRIALIIQGIFDRSEALHPHPPVKTWTRDGFESAIHLVYDDSLTLTFGDKPDFEAYRKACNATITSGSMVVGQSLYWMQAEAEKENKRIDNDWRNRDKHHHKTFEPYGDPGPGYITKINEWKPKSKMASFLWNRERLTGDTWTLGRHIETKINVPMDRLFNADAYQLGDYKQFFRDPRSRAEYLKWAPMLMAAEEYQAKK